MNHYLIHWQSKKTQSKEISLNIPHQWLKDNHCFLRLHFYQWIVLNPYLIHYQSKKTQNKEISLISDQLLQDNHCSLSLHFHQWIFLDPCLIYCQNKKTRAKKLLERYLISCSKIIIAFPAFVTMYETFSITIWFPYDIKKFIAVVRNYYETISAVGIFAYFLLVGVQTLVKRKQFVMLIFSKPSSVWILANTPLSFSLVSN